MISKEKLANGYIVNDKGVLRQLWVDAVNKLEFDTGWWRESLVFDSLTDALNNKYCFIDENVVDSADFDSYIEGKDELFFHDFVDTDCSPCITRCIVPSDVTLPPQNDIFKRMLSIAKENNLFIQFDGFTQDENNTIVVTHAASDTEYVVKDEAEFNKLVESLNVLEKFERK
ncbi:hypothetical protein VPIG_00025 [Vibrio phage PWH3a-P1]|uniref:hypothetical protein n=1 Tax=Vibrio phage PWH3a-P1 TaxID=754058 RepID=UPI0002C0CFD0|nr:hypothetical protein VPIG_00025 [Vibrio phage PWH3a-P1]AGH31883.1 hypothetical protein VPIG_00025 [Vibrio phage PWH3a-P1]